MPDEFNELQDKAKRLINKVGECKKSIDNLKKNFLIQVDDIEKEISELLGDTLATHEKWADSKDKHDDIRKSINGELPERIRRLEEILKQAQSGLETGYDEAKFVVRGGVVLLVALVLVYAGLHLNYKNPSYNEATAEKLFRALGQVKAAVVKKQISAEEVAGALDTLMLGNKKDLLTVEFSEDINYLKGIATNIKEYPNSKPSESSSGSEPPGASESSSGSEPSETSKSVSGSEDSETATTPTYTVLWSEDPRIAEIGKIVEDIHKRAKGLPKFGGFFWTTGGWRWLEVLFWGEFGVIVGILVWVSTQMLKSTYTKLQYKKEKYWYFTELIIGPIVIMAVFFLLKQSTVTILKGITTETIKGSIYMTLGLSFTLGLFLRRTLGIFDVIKQRMPVPGQSKK